MLTVLVEGLDIDDFLHDVFRQDFASVLGDEEVILDAHADAKFLEIEAGFVGDDVARDQRFGTFGIARIMRVQTDMMGDAMEIVFLDLFFGLDELLVETFRGEIFDREVLQFLDGSARTGKGSDGFVRS